MLIFYVALEGFATKPTQKTEPYFFFSSENVAQRTGKPNLYEVFSSVEKEKKRATDGDDTGN